MLEPLQAINALPGGALTLREKTGSAEYTFARYAVTVLRLLLCRLLRRERLQTHWSAGADDIQSHERGRKGLQV